MPFITNEKALQTHNVHQGKRKESLNYAKHVPQAPKLVPPGANPFYIIHNIQDTARWSLGMLQDGMDAYGDDMRMGDRYFVKSGTCSNVKSVPECQGKSRYMYIDNVPSPSVPCADPNQPSDPKSAKMPQGLLAGVVQDIVELNPFELMQSATGSGSVVNNACVMRTERVDSILPYQREHPKYETRCAPKREPLVCSMSALKESSCTRYAYTFDDTENNKSASEIRKNTSASASTSTSASASASTSTSTTFKRGEEVTANYKNKGRYIPAIIKHDHNNGTYDVYYADVSESNRDMADLFDTMSSVDYTFRTVRVIDQRQMAKKPYETHWTHLIGTVNEEFKQTLKKKHNTSVEVHSHKHCLARAIELEDRGGRKWLKMLWTNLYQVKFESLTNVVVREHDQVIVRQTSGSAETKTGRVTKVHNADNADNTDNTGSASTTTTADSASTTTTAGTTGTTPTTETTPPTPTYDIKFEDSTTDTVTSADIVELHYNFQAFWTACVNLSQPSSSDEYFKGDRVLIKQGGTFTDPKVAKVIQTNPDDTFEVQFYDPAKTILHSVKRTDIQTIKHLIISGDVVGNSYKAFSEEPEGYYIVGVREPFVGAPSHPNPSVAPHWPMSVLFVVVIVCVLLKMVLSRLC